MNVFTLVSVASVLSVSVPTLAFAEGLFATDILCGAQKEHCSSTDVVKIEDKDLIELVRKNVVLYDLSHAKYIDYKYEYKLIEI